MATTPVTVKEFRRFVNETQRDIERGAFGYTSDLKLWNYVNQSWDNTRFRQDGSHPVTCVSALDCDDYIAWLRDKTGISSYRLLSEAEWEYCCRAGTTTWYSCGEKLTHSTANFDARVNFDKKDEGWREGTLPVKIFTANAWGLFQMHGNVLEWCADPWHEDYAGAPDTGRIWVGGHSKFRVIRGGSWWDAPWDLRSASRECMERDVRADHVGFRLARDI